MNHEITTLDQWRIQIQDMLANLTQESASLPLITLYDRAYHEFMLSVTLPLTPVHRSLLALLMSGNIKGLETQVARARGAGDMCNRFSDMLAKYQPAVSSQTQNNTEFMLSDEIEDIPTILPKFPDEKVENGISHSSEKNKSGLLSLDEI